MLPRLSPHFLIPLLQELLAVRCRYTTMKLLSTILIASTAAALKAPRAAPTKALQVPRGGGMVEKSTALTVTKAPCRVLARGRPRHDRG